MKFTQRLILMTAASACLLAAQDDPPGRVARMSYLYGTASFLPAGVNDWAPADYNRPLTSGDQVFVDFAGTVELETGAAVLRLGSATALEFLNLDDSNMQIRLTEGTLIIRLRSLGDQDSVEVDTPSLAFSLLRTGEYRIQVKPDSALTTVTVRGGEGELTGANQAFTVHAGEQMQVTGTDQPDYQTFSAPPRDTLENFALQRDQRDDQSPSARYVSREMVGYQDLDKYGSWRDTPDYGAVWVPNETPSGWAPYHNGHWVWQDPWGWTWVDDAPWGFAPAHYGRWAYVGNYWGWVPGPVAERPVYAPALVAWVGGGAIGGGVAWFALGPREVYVPTYHTSPAYVNRVNVTNTVIVNNINITNINTTTVNYRNRTAPGAMMAVQQEAFASARPVQSAAIAVRPEAARSAPVVASVSIAPTRASIVRAPVPGGTARVAQPPPAVQSVAVIARKTPPPPPVPFAQKQAALAANGGRPLDVKQVQQLRQSQPPPVRPQVRQVQAQAPSAAPPSRGPAPQAPAAQAPPQRPAAVTPTPAPPPQQPPVPEARPTQQAPPSRPVPEARPAQQPTPQPRETQPPPPERPTPPQQQRPAPEARPTPQVPPSRPAPEARPTPQPTPLPRETQPPPPERTAPPPQQRPAPEARPAPQAPPSRPAPETRPTPEPKPEVRREATPPPAPSRPAPQAQRPAPPPPKQAAPPPAAKDEKKDKEKKKDEK